MFPLKTLLKIITVAIIFLALFYIFLSFFLPGKVAHDISQKIKTAVKIESIFLSLDAIRVKNLEIDNPPSSEFPKALTVKKITVDALLTNYLSKKIIIDEISLDQVYLSLEFNSAQGTSGNWTTLMNNIQSSQGHTPDPKHSSLNIKKLNLKDIQVVVFYKDTKATKTLPLIKTITLTDINTENGLPMDQVMQSVLGQMLTSIFVQENMKNMLEEIMEPQNEIRSLLTPLENLFK